MPLMIYLSGCIVPFRHRKLGFMVTPQMWNNVPLDAWWAADNGRYAAPERYTDAGYFYWLQRQPRQYNIFATAPDVLGDHAATVAMSTPVFSGIVACGFRSAFVAQDGWEEHTTPWNQFVCLFIGGTDEFKLGRGLEAARIGREKYNKWVHMGRVNSFKRLKLAQEHGCWSADGTFLKYAPENNIPRMLNWFAKL